MYVIPTWSVQWTDRAGKTHALRMPEPDLSTFVNALLMSNVIAIEFKRESSPLDEILEPPKVRDSP